MDLIFKNIIKVILIIGSIYFIYTFINYQLEIRDIESGISDIADKIDQLYREKNLESPQRKTYFYFDWTIFLELYYMLFFVTVIVYLVYPEKKTPKIRKLERNIKELELENKLNKLNNP